MKKLYLANSLLLFDFWITIAIPYIVHRGLSLDQAVGLISLYTLLVTFLEYPTGVIGDYFGHKTSVVLGTLCAVFSYILLFIANNYVLFLIALLARALAMTLRSGSTEALFKSHSHSTKKDFANFFAIEDVVLFFASVLAGFIAQTNFNLAIGINIMTALISLVMIITFKTKTHERKAEGNIFALANEGLVQVIKHAKLLLPILLLMFFYSYGRNVKSMFGMMRELYDFKLSYLGIIIGGGMLVRSFGKYAYGRYKKLNINLVIISFLILLFLTGFLNNYWVIIGSILVLNGLMGTILSWLQIDIIEHTSAHVRASVLSFSGLLTTLSSSLYLFAFGKISVALSIPFALFLTALLLAVVYGGSLLVARRKLFNRVQS